jgi:hypothetical protein
MSPLQSPYRLMLFRETVTVCCENHTEHTDTLCGQNAEFYCVQFVTHRKHVFATKLSLLMLFREALFIVSSRLSK